MYRCNCFVKSSICFGVFYTTLSTVDICATMMNYYIPKNIGELLCSGSISTSILLSTNKYTGELFFIIGCSGIGIYFHTLYKNWSSYSYKVKKFALIAAFTSMMCLKTFFIEPSIRKEELIRYNERIDNMYLYNGYVEDNSYSDVW